MEVHSTLTGKRGVSLPFTDACEPIGFTRDNFSAALQHLNAYGRTNQWKYWEIRGGSDLLGNHPPSLTFYTHKLDLTPGEGNVFANFESSVRRAIRKAEKCDVQVEISQSEEAMRHFYSLQCKTRKKHGLPPQPFSFFLNICRHLLAKNLGFVAVAKFKDKPVSASVFLQMNGHAVYKFGASDERFQDLRGANLVMWRGIQHCIRSSARDLDFGRTSLGNEGLRRFKLGWGATEQQKSYFKYDLRRNQFVKDSDRASGWHNLVFSQMPIGLLRIVGSLLYRHLA
ncbi:MAG TPA: GNAT family N-acetyltransferase [Verrucomicrobiae bacterium]